MGQNHSVESRPSFDFLPEDCISNIISFTSPRDACVAASVSKTFESAANANSVWEKFLPAINLQKEQFASYKEMYFYLCDPVLLEDDRKVSFWLEKASGKWCIMLSPKTFRTSGSTDAFWQHTPVPEWAESRFRKMVGISGVCWFEIYAEVETQYLSPRTRYSVYIVFTTNTRRAGLENVPIQAGIELTGQEYSQNLFYFVASGEKETDQDVMKPKQREDGWMEAEVGEFLNESGCDDISIRVRETKSLYWKSGLIIQGFEFRPTKTS